MINNRIRELRKSFDMSQKNLAAIIGTTQQAVSRMENNTYSIPSDLLIKMAHIFNVTTDYMLGISCIKRSYVEQVCVKQEISKYYTIVQRYNNLSKTNQRTLCCIFKCLEQAQRENDESPTKEIN